MSNDNNQDEQERNRVSIVWQESDSSNFDSNWAHEALDVLDEAVEEHSDTINKSRYIGASIQFFYADDYLARQEARLDTELEKEGIDISRIQYELSMESLANTVGCDPIKIMDKDEWDYSEKSRFVATVPSVLKDYVSAACDEDPKYTNSQKIRWVCNAIMGFSESIFDSRTQRVETKEQILRVARGETVYTKDMNTVTARIRDGEILEEIYQDVFLEQTKETTLSGEIVDLNKLDVDSDVSLEWHSSAREQGLGKDEGIGIIKKGEQRTAVFLACLRGNLKEYGGRDGWEENYLQTQVSEMNKDFESGYLWNNYVEDYFTRGIDDLLYLDEDNAPIPDRFDSPEQMKKYQFAHDIVKLVSPRKQNRKLESAISNRASSGCLDGVDTGANGLRDENVLVEGLSLSELKMVRDYLAKGLDEKLVLGMVESGDLVSVSETYVDENY